MRRMSKKWSTYVIPRALDGVGGSLVHIDPTVFTRFFLRGAVSIFFKSSSGLAMVACFLFKFPSSVVSIFGIMIIPAIAALGCGPLQIPDGQSSSMRPGPVEMVNLRLHSPRTWRCRCFSCPRRSHTSHNSPLPQKVWTACRR